MRSCVPRWATVRHCVRSDSIAMVERSTIVGRVSRGLVGSMRCELVPWASIAPTPLKSIVSGAVMVSPLTVTKVNYPCCLGGCFETRTAAAPFLR